MRSYMQRKPDVRSLAMERRATKAAQLDSLSPLQRAENLASHSPKVEEIFRLRHLLDSGPETIQTKGDRSAGPAVQFSGFIYAGSSQTKIRQYQEIIQNLQKDKDVAALIDAVLAEGDVTIKPDSEDDTRWDSKSRTIFVSSKKKKDEVTAAILFELNNAINPHTYTKGAERGLSKMGKKKKEPTGIDYYSVAREMEKDEFVSLVNYARQVEGLGIKKSKLHEKYSDLQEEDGNLSYEKFEQQNLSSNHTRDLALAQHANFTGKGERQFPEAPLKVTQPGDYSRYVEEWSEERKSTRHRDQFLGRLKEQSEGEVATEATPLLKRYFVEFDPSNLTPMYLSPQETVGEGSSDTSGKKRPHEDVSGSSEQVKKKRKLKK